MMSCRQLQAVSPPAGELQLHPHLFRGGGLQPGHATTGQKQAAEMTRHDAYRAGLCIDCQTVRYSAGRPRCNDCHATHIRELDR